MNEKDQYLTQLFSGYVEGTLSKPEYNKLFALLEYVDEEELGTLIEQFLQDKRYTISEDAILHERTKALYLKIVENITPAPAEPKNIIPKIGRSKRMRYQITAAACILALLTTLAINHLINPSDTDRITVNDIDGATMSALMTLNDGSTIKLDSLKKGHYELPGGLTLSKAEDGTIRYIYSESTLEGSSQNTLTKIETPRGGFIVIELPDGSKAHLNAQSSIRHPVRFSDDIREVFVEGEVFLEVKKDLTKPFLAHMMNQEIEVLGTSFNINTYNYDRVGTITTLIEGKINITNGDSKAIMAPGQQAIAKGSIRLKTVDVESVIAWTQGKFSFHNSPLTDVIAEIERCYDVQFVFTSTELKNEYLSGSIRRDVPLSVLLHVLEMNTKYKFEIKERRVFVSQ